ncbi:hypothetical protein FRC10_003017 [Ceratobasidium sp. 414]|nr:hypothetical protein FRC10_003017 [Ceratobasidium sp. 414]
MSDERQVGVYSALSLLQLAKSCFASLDAIKREGDLPARGSPDDTSTVCPSLHARHDQTGSLEALVVKQEPRDTPTKLTKEVSKIAPRAAACRRAIYLQGKSKGSVHAEIPSDWWIIYNYKYFVAHNDDGELEIYFWDTPMRELGKLYSVNPTNSVLKFCKDATEEFTMCGNTYKPDVPNQTLRMGEDTIVVLDSFEAARGFYSKTCVEELPSEECATKS